MLWSHWMGHVTVLTQALKRCAFDVTQILHWTSHDWKIWPSVEYIYIASLGFCFARAPSFTVDYSPWYKFNSSFVKLAYSCPFIPKLHYIRKFVNMFKALAQKAKHDGQDLAELGFLPSSPPRAALSTSLELVWFELGSFSRKFCLRSYSIKSLIFRFVLRLIPWTYKTRSPFSSRHSFLGAWRSSDWIFSIAEIGSQTAQPNQPHPPITWTR